MPGLSLSGQALIGIVLAAIMTAIANVLIRSGIQRFGGFSPADPLDVVRQFVQLLLQPLFFAGFVIYFAAALVWFRTIAIAPLSVAYPLLVSLTFVAVTGGSVLLWGEPLTVGKLAGLALIIAGIVLVSASAVQA